MRTAIAIVVVSVLGGVAHADDSVVVSKESAEATLAHPDLVYVELFGKAGLYGVGYERRITRRLSLGTAVSYDVVRGQRLATAAPYVHARLRGAWFTEVGAVLTHSSIASHVADWDGMSATGGGGFASVGWEHRFGRLLVRPSASVVAGAGGASPWLGVAFGGRP